MANGECQMHVGWSGFIGRFPDCSEGRVIGQQLLRSATSVAANYRAVCKARSRADFISKLGIVEQEADETFWLEFFAETALMKKERPRNLVSEGKQLTAIFRSSRKTSKKNSRQSVVENPK